MDEESLQALKIEAIYLRDLTKRLRKCSEVLQGELILATGVAQKLDDAIIRLVTAKEP